MKVLSFVVPAYNSESFLDVVLPSLLCPEVLDKLEILVVNDGSTDATAAVAQRYCQQYPDTIRLICQENRGHGGALNTGCAAATGKFLKVIDADDWIETENLPAFLQLLEACGSDVVLTHYRTVDISTGETRAWQCFPEAFGRGYSLEEILAQWNSFDMSLTFHGITYRTAFYQARGIPLSEHVFYEDYEYATFPCCHAQQITPFDLFLYDYRIGDTAQSVSDASRVRRIGHIETVLDRMMAEYRALPESEEAARAYTAVKLQELLLSYLTTALLVHPDLALGRKLAREQMTVCKRSVPQAYAMAKWKYAVFFAMNRLHIRKQTWERVLRAKWYRLLRGKRQAD